MLIASFFLHSFLIQVFKEREKVASSVPVSDRLSSLAHSTALLIAERLIGLDVIKQVSTHKSDLGSFILSFPPKVGDLIRISPQYLTRFSDTRRSTTPSALQSLSRS